MRQLIGMQRNLNFDSHRKFAFVERNKALQNEEHGQIGQGKVGCTTSHCTVCDVKGVLGARVGEW
jgi:hypothetical protein